MASGSSGMGMRKHGKSGLRVKNGKSPKFRANAKREAERQERKAPKPLPFKSVSEVFR